MKSFFSALGSITLATTTSVIANFQQTNNLVKINSDTEIQEITINLSNYNKDFVNASYQPNNPRASFHYLDITKFIKENLNQSIITFNKIYFNHQQNEIHTKAFESLVTKNNILESATLANPAYWNDQTFHKYTSLLYNHTINKGVTSYNAQLAAGLTKDINTGKIYFVWGIYGHVVLGNNQAIVTSQVSKVVIKY